MFGAERKTIQHRIRHGPRVCPKPKSNPTGLLDGEGVMFGAERKTIQHRIRHGPRVCPGPKPT